MQGPFGVEVLLLDEPQGFGVKHPVPENQQVQLQDVGVLLQVPGDSVLEEGQLRFDLVHRLPETLLFLSHILFGVQEAGADLGGLSQDLDPPQDDPRGGGDALEETVFPAHVSPNLRANSEAIDMAASRAWGAAGPQHQAASLGAVQGQDGQADPGRRPPPRPSPG